MPIRRLIDNNLTFKFYNRYIHSNFKNNRVKRSQERFQVNSIGGERNNFTKEYRFAKQKLKTSMPIC